MIDANGPGSEAIKVLVIMAFGAGKNNMFQAMDRYISATAKVDKITVPTPRFNHDKGAS